MPPVALVTGATSGIGLATATLLAQHGYALAISGRTQERLDDAARTLSPTSSTHPADLSDPDQAGPLVDAVLARQGRLDVIINNAGWSPSATIPQTTPEIATRVFGLNAISPTLIIARAWPTMVAQAQRDGTNAVIVNVSSIATRDPFPMLFAYAAAKSSLNSLALSVARQGAPHGIRGFAVAPGSVETPLLRSLVDETSVPQSRTLAPADVAQVILACVLGHRDQDNGSTIFLPSE